MYSYYYFTFLLLFSGLEFDCISKYHLLINLFDYVILGGPFEGYMGMKPMESGIWALCTKYCFKKLFQNSPFVFLVSSHHGSM